jgi:ACS family pantothenate transporter-like MFS transporter
MVVYMADIAPPRFSALMAAAHDVRMMYALRFFIGVFEASSYPGIISILCNW